MVPIGGTAMVPLAALLAESGHTVTGSDRDLYPPMSTLLAKLAIPAFRGFSADHIPADCDTVIVGNAATRDNPEALEASRRNLPVLSMPQAIFQFLLPGRTPVVITGTHGKTTTSALTAWLLHDAGRDPGFLVGGQMRNFGRGYALGRGPHFVLEGDEYNAAYFDRGPKFLHYAPRHLYIGNIEFDHADLYPDLASIHEAFRNVASLVPADGVVVTNRDDPSTQEAARASAASQVTTSTQDVQADFAAADIAFGTEDTEFLLVESGQPTTRLRSPLFGLHNVSNTLGAIALTRGLGLTVSEIARSLPRFAGVQRRLEVVGVINNIYIVDDFAHHPTAVRGTLQAARRRWPDRRLWALFEPRSNTAGRKIFEQEYVESFSGADALVIAPVFHAQRLTAEGMIDREAIAKRFAADGKHAWTPETIDEIPQILRREARPGDVLILMSSGAFGGLPGELPGLLAKG